MTVVDSSVAVDYLLGIGAEQEVHDLLLEEELRTFAAPEILVVEVISAIRRLSRLGLAPLRRTTAAIEDLSSLRVDLFPMIGLRRRAWELRENLIVPDAMFVALAELLDEPLATKDKSLARAAAKHTDVETILLGA